VRAILSLSILPLLASSVPAANDALIAAIATRSAKFPAIDARFHVLEMMEKGSRFNEPGKVIPPHDFVWESDNRWVLDGEKYRYERNHPNWNTNGGKTQSSILMTCDGKMHKALVKRPDQLNSDSGIIEDGSNGLHYGDIYLRPLTIHFRGIEKRVLGCEPTELKQVAKGIPVNGIPCDEFEHAFGKSNIATYTYWFDPARDHVLVRMRWSNKGIPSHLIDIEYAEREGFGLVPSRWNYTQFRTNGKIQSKSVVELKTLAKVADNPKSTFDIDFPKRSIVYDNRFQNTKYRVNDLGQLIELDILGQPVGSTVVPVLVRLWFLKLRTWLLVGSLLGIAAMLGYCWMRWRRTRSTVRRALPTAELPFV
jgi:hypothetical protein